MPKWLLVIGFVLIAASSLGTLAIGLWLLFEAVRFHCFAVRARGKVVRMHAQVEQVQRSNDTSSWTQEVVVYYPVIAFEDPTGFKHEVQANFGTLCQPSYEVGDSVSILFAKNHPQAMRINSLMSLYYNPLCLLGIAAGGTIILVFWGLYLWR